MADKRKPLILNLEPLDPTAEADAAADEALFTRPQPAATPAPIPTPQRPPSPTVRSAAPAAAPRETTLRRPVAVAPPPPADEAPWPKPKGAAKPKAAAVERPAARAEAGPAILRWAWPMALAGAVLWAGCLTTFVLGYERGGSAFGYPPFRWAVAAGLAILPAALMLLFGYAARQSARLAEEARRTRALVDELSAPAQLAAAKMAGGAGVMREEMAKAQAAAEEAARRVGQLHAALSEETRLVTEAAEKAERAATMLGGRLQSERAELNALAGVLDAQLASAAEGAAKHSRLAAEASDLAHANLEEAQASLAARTADLISAAQEASRAAEGAGAQLGREGERLRALSEDLRRGQAEWADAAQALLAEEEDVQTRMETGRARFVAVVADTRAGAETLQRAAGEGAETLRELIGEAGRHARALTDTMQAEAEESVAIVAAQRASLEAETRAALERLSAAAEAARAIAGRSAAALQAEAEAAGEAARLRMEGLAESAFSAGQRADAAFEQRLAGAKRAIEAQAGLVEDAGIRSAQRIEHGLEALRAALSEAESLAAEVERRWAEAPRELTAAAPAHAPAPHEPSQPIRVTPGPSPAITVRAPPVIVRPALAPTTAPASLEPSTLRPRLRLEPTVDEELFAAPGSPTAPETPAPAGDADGWSWKDLLTAMDDGGGPAEDDEALADKMIEEISAMGVDPGALLPRARIDEIAKAMDAGDRGRAREAVRRLAPAAVRRLSRRVLTDKVLRGQADRYRLRYGALVADKAGAQAGATSTLLGSDPGRAWLLLDAAVGDLH